MHSSSNKQIKRIEGHENENFLKNKSGLQRGQGHYFHRAVGQRRTKQVFLREAICSLKNHAEDKKITKFLCKACNIFICDLHGKKHPCKTKSPKENIGVALTEEEHILQFMHKNA